MNKLTTEKEFQAHIVKKFVESGYEVRPSQNYDPVFAIDRDALYRFLSATQPQAMERLEKLYGDKTLDTIVGNISAVETSKNGSRLSLLKDGLTVSNVKLELSYQKPETSFNRDTTERYKQNIFSVMEEVWASSKERVDLVLFLNGLAFAVFELKSNTAGQDYRNAIEQYRKEREPKTRLFQFKSGAIAAFAMDLHEVYMTTKLDKAATYFLPFNQGNGTGVNAGKGNPELEDDYDVRYMWEDVLQKDSVLEIVHKFAFVDHKEKTEPDGKTKISDTLVFPRYHQLDLIRKTMADVRVNLSSQNYLIQHSAGSGKTYEIAWLAHRLATLHDEQDRIIFDAVVVCTDRVVVDRQLQAALRSIKRQSGFVQVMDEKCGSADLADALQRNAKIVATTIQKFNYITDAVKNLGKKTFAVIIDESHSSTSGKTMTSVNQSLTTEDELATIDEIAERQQKSGGKLPNLSLFGFTATPKATTLELFGRTNEHGQKEAFHVYSMKQAIEEGFILDVLQNYTTYKTFCELNKTIEDDPRLDKSKAKRQIARFIDLHPTNVRQRVEIVVEHFRAVVMNELGGHAKAMVVTASREAAVRFKLAMDEYIAEKGYDDLKTLVAFTGTVGADGVDYTERGMNNIPEDRLPERFDSDEYQLLLVANKYQTGFDQRKLCAMYVFKKLKGVNAVQTLSRLNRTCPPYDDKKTFVLDFVNDYEDMQNAFAPYYTSTLLGNTVVPNDIYNLEAKIDGYLVLDPSEMDEFFEAVYSDKTPGEVKRKIEGKLLKLKKYVENTYADDQQREIASLIRKFIRFYEFILVTTSFNDVALHKKYVYLTYFIKVMNLDAPGAGVDLIGKIKATRFEQKKTSEHVGDKVVSDPIVKLPEADSVPKPNKLEERLSVIIDEINNRLGAEFDKPLVMSAIGQALNALMANEDIKTRAKNNTESDFNLAFMDDVQDVLTDQYEQHQEFFGYLLKNEEARKEIFSLYSGEVYNRLRAA